MHAERDILIKRIFPQLRKLCEERGVTWTEVDLRWGITEEEKAEGKVLPLCLAEIERCRPHFIGLLGERYGWVPESIPGDLIESQPWLREHLEQSVTELEILHGVLCNPAMADRSVFYFRDPAFVDTVPEEDRKDFTAENAESAEKLRRLKEKVHQAHAEDKLRYAPRENYSGPEALGELLLADFIAIIDDLYPKEEVPDPLDQEAARHEAYARSRRLAFFGRGDLLHRIDVHVSSAEAKPLVLTGESGCGKSALLAEWVARWRKKHPDDLVIQHFIGSTPESADWQGIVRRILGELKRTFEIADEIPLQAEALRTVLNDWFVKTAGGRRIVLVLDALNQLSGDDPAARQLGWLPVVAPRNMRLLVSSLQGESLDVLKRHGWPELGVPLFGPADIRPAAEEYFTIFAKTPSEQMLKALESTPATCNALFLRSVLDELRQFGEHRRLAERTAWYLSTSSLLDLFDRILTRWDEDFGRDPDNPHVVRRGLCLIACARFGLSEAELLDLLGQDGKPLPRRLWTPFYLAAESALAVRAGLLNFGHDYLRAAIFKRWLGGADTERQFRLQLAGYFAAVIEPTNRKLDELPALLRDTTEWERLKNLLVDLPTFLRLRSTQRWKWELHRLWLILGDHYDPVTVCRDALAEVGPDLARERLVYLLVETAGFHYDAGRYAAAEPLYRQAMEISRKVVREDHREFATCLNKLANLYLAMGNYAAAEPLYRQAIEISRKVVGEDHPDFATCLNCLAESHRAMGNYAAAEPLYRQAMEISRRVVGENHPDFAQILNNLASLCVLMGNYAAAEPLYRQAMEIIRKSLGEDHPDFAQSLNNLGHMYWSMGSYAAAEPLYRQAMELRRKVLGEDHPDFAQIMNNLALLYVWMGNYGEAEPLYRRALSISEKALGPLHELTSTILHNLGELHWNMSDYTMAETLFCKALDRTEKALGPEHPNTAASLHNVAACRALKGDYAAAEPLYRRALAIRTKALGADHPYTALSMNNLGGLLCKKGDYVEAELLLRRALAFCEKALGPEHQLTTRSLLGLAELLVATSRATEAEPYALQVASVLERTLGREHRDAQAAVSLLRRIRSGPIQSTIRGIFERLRSFFSRS